MGSVQQECIELEARQDLHSISSNGMTQRGGERVGMMPALRSSILWIDFAPPMSYRHAQKVVDE